MRVSEDTWCWCLRRDDDEEEGDYDDYDGMTTTTNVGPRRGDYDEATTGMGLRRDEQDEQMEDEGPDEQTVAVRDDIMLGPLTPGLM